MPREFILGLTANRRRVLLGLASLPTVAIAAPALSVRDFSALPDGSDAGPGFARACDALARRGGGRLLVPAGIYAIAAMSGAAIRLENLANVEIAADGAELQLNGLCRAVSAQNCRGLRIRGLTVDWRRPPFSQGEVAALSRNGREVEVALDAATPFDGWTQVEAIGAYERATRLVTRRQVDAYDCVDAVEGISPRRVRLRLSHEIGLRGGETLVLRHVAYAAEAIELKNCRDVEVSLVTVRTAPGIAIRAWRCTNVTLNGCVVAAAPGLLMSSVADAAHCIDCEGDIRVDACRFTDMGDDGLNVHGTYLRIAACEGRALTVAKPRDEGFADEEVPPAGARFAVISGRTLETLGEAQIARSSRSGRRLTLVLADDPPATLGVGDAVIDTRTTKLTVRLSRFGGNRARGVLAHSNATIEDCEFHDQSLEAILLCPDLVWQEGPAATHVRIARNVIVGANRWSTDGGAIRADAVVNGGLTTPGHPNRDIVLEDNVIRGTPEPNVVLRGM